MDPSRVRVALLLLLVFGAGLAGGVALERLWLDGSAEDPRRGRHGPVIQRYADSLDLTDAQRARVDSIVDRFRERMEELWSRVEPRYRRMADSARGEIEAVLEPDQVDRYRRLLEQERRRHGFDEDEPADSAARDRPDDATRPGEENR